MDPAIRQLDFEGRRLAYSTYGDGPPIVFGPRWVSHLEEEWADPRQRAFYEEIALTHQVVRFDRVGCGLSSRELDPLPTVESESRQLEAVIDAVGAPAIVFASSCSCLAASQLAVRRDGAIDKLVYFGGYATRDDIPDVTKRSLIEFVRTNWSLGAAMLAGLFDPHASGDEIAEYTRQQRRAASAQAAAIFMELDLDADLRPVLPHVDRSAATRISHGVTTAAS
jgi:pimeloyl-ACP methyl ester carboxylesterase